MLERVYYTNWKRVWERQLHSEKRGGVRGRWTIIYPEKSEGVRLEIKEGGLFWVKGGGVGGGWRGGGGKQCKAHSWP